MRTQMLFFGLIDFLLKDSTFDFVTTIGYVNNTLIFYYCSHQPAFGKAGLASLIVIVNFNITDRGGVLL